MDPPSTVKSFKYSSKQQPMFSVVETPPPLHYNNSTLAQEASFSSYLKHKDPSQKPYNAEDTEISIFDAQKYFSCENNDPMKKQASHDVMSVPRLSSVSSTDGYGRNFRTRSFHATPTASSEASWNSQTGLLANPPGVGINLRKFASDDGKRANSAVRKWGFGRKCCCTGKKSVEVKETTTSDSELGGPVVGAAVNNNDIVKPNFLYGKRDSPTISNISSSSTNDILEIQQQKVVPASGFDPPRQQRISASGVGGFSFPILNTSNQVTKPVLKGIITKPVINPLEDPPRDSLEVFQPMHEAGARFNPGSPAARVLNTDDDVGSDASSDLFEIESFSTQTTSYPMNTRRDSLDEAPAFNVRRFAAANGINLYNNSNIQYGRRSLDEPPTPSVAATECYAPSEVSIDWSVTTAEGFDRASVSNFSISASERGSMTFMRQRLQEEGGGESGKKKGNGGGLLLMSCRQEKAVSVGPQPVKCVAAEGALMFPAQVGVHGRPPRANKPPLGSDHSARLSLAFAA